MNFVHNMATLPFSTTICEVDKCLRYGSSQKHIPSLGVTHTYMNKN